MFLRGFFQLACRSYCNEIEARNRDEISYSLGIVPMGL